VPGTDFQPGPQIASIPPRPWQVPGTDFQPRRVLGRCLAPISIQPAPQIASIPPRPWQVPGTDFQPGPQIASIPPRPWQVPGTDLAAVSIRSGRSQATVDPPRRTPSVLGAPGTGFLLLTDRTD
jgi:hypothetical protein